MPGCTEMDRYLFDLNGFLVLKNVLSDDEVAACNTVLDELQDTGPGEWRGYVHGHNFTGSHEGLNLQQIYEAGEPFEKLIDHPSWIDKVLHFLGTDQNNFDGLHGPCFIDENFASIRGPGQAIGLHSGGQERVTRCQFRYHDGRFHCGQINLLMAFNDIGEGDGATMVIPGSHKSNVLHPEFDAAAMATVATSVDGVTGAVEVFLEAGDAILFVDAIMHGSAARRNPGQRRIAVYRYGPSWGFFRHNYRPSDELLSRLSPAQRQIVMPHKRPQVPPDR
ncbi:MAG: phytanoyl-CoA dioxygenase family protein [Albidovulum sp.]|nr:phytanoyl-CoA dioxygenase family protein [Albidovulum sp.]MDE0532151.1 phytanoyl-CoA dioxygenase family protein [Albidovulum sp.]